MCCRSTAECSPLKMSVCATCFPSSQTNERHPVGVSPICSPAHLPTSSSISAIDKKKAKTMKRSFTCPPPPLPHTNLSCSNSSTYKPFVPPPHVAFHYSKVSATAHNDLSALWNTTTGTAAAFLVRSALCGEGPAAVQAGELGIVMSVVILFRLS